LFEPLQPHAHNLADFAACAVSAHSAQFTKLPVHGNCKYSMSSSGSGKSSLLNYIYCRCRAVLLQQLGSMILFLRIPLIKKLINIQSC